ncbi:MAG: cupin domain-containing protein [Proteobacteria bacterium]|nr:cupin domain-containing protein [Pseudomonadota bacterium]
MSATDSLADRLQLASLIRRGEHAAFSDEYNCKLRRLFPWPGRVETHRPVTEFGVIWVRLDPGVDVDEHEHDEEETFIVVSGSAVLTLEGETANLRKGDVAYIPRFARHSIRNLSSLEAFEMIDVYWDKGGRNGSKP